MSSTSQFLVFCGRKPAFFFNENELMLIRDTVETHSYESLFLKENVFMLEKALILKQFLFKMVLEKLKAPKRRIPLLPLGDCKNALHHGS